MRANRTRETEMPVSKIAHHPELTREQAQDLFRKHFEGKYKVEDFRGPYRDFIVVKNPFVGVAVKLEQTGKETKFVYSGQARRLWAGLLSAGGIGMLIRNKLTTEIKQYIQTAPEFK
jgi:hypothetical protein